jgi:hypothetical protein
VIAKAGMALERALRSPSGSSQLARTLKLLATKN